MYIYLYIICIYYAVQELTQLQDKHATRPDVFDDVEEEQEIEILTQEITQVCRTAIVMQSVVDIVYVMFTPCLFTAPYVFMHCWFNFDVGRKLIDVVTNSAQSTPTDYVLISAWGEP